jgi:hypothetical protein
MPRVQNAPVFLYICGEGPCTPGFIGNQRFMHDLAVEQGALLIALEHRHVGMQAPGCTALGLALGFARAALLEQRAGWFCAHCERRG